MNPAVSLLRANRSGSQGQASDYPLFDGYINPPISHNLSDQS